MKALAAALVAAQNEMPAVKADARNPHFNSEFVSLDHLIAQTKPVLTKHGLSIVQAPSHIDGQLALSSSLVHVSGETVEWEMPLVLVKQDMQAVGAALTYARRYAWAAILGICDESDDDGNRASSGAVTHGGAGAGISSPKPEAERANPAPAPASGTPGDFVWDVGQKHPGKTIAAIQAADPAYLTWAVQNITKPPDHVAALSAFFASVSEAAVQEELAAVGGEWVDSDIPF